MFDHLQSAWRSARQGVELVADGVTTVDPLWLVLGVLLHVLHQIVRTRGWFNIIRAAHPEAHGLRARDVTLAYLAGAGLNGAVPARGGDLAKLWVIRHRAPETRWSTLLATFVPETLFETAFGAALVVWALSHGFLPVPTASRELPSLDVTLVYEHPFLSAIAAAAIGAGAVLLFRWLGRRAGDVVARMRQGLAILERPRDFLTGVITWQALGRVIRLVSIACCMEAFALPVTLETVVLVMAAQGGSRIIPLAPASTGLRIAMLTYGLVEISGQAVDIARITAFAFGVGASLFVTGFVISMVILGRELGTVSPRETLRRLTAQLRRVTPKDADLRSGPHIG